jgi:hypothetical protein
MTNPLRIARVGSTDINLLPGMGNRHGLITGATGTGKTVTLQAMAQAFSGIGVPVFMADIKGDLSGMAKPGSATPKVQERLNLLQIGDFEFAGCPVAFWDAFQAAGHPVRATVSDMGPLLFSRILNLNETQAGVLTLIYRIADDNGLLLMDLKDLRAMVQYVGDNAKQFTTEYGNVSAASVGAIQRGLLQIEEQGGDKLFGEPMLDIQDLMQTDSSGRGVVNILAADRLMNSPKLYSTLLLWLLAELFENLPEVGDLEKPKMVFFFDEAHLLFNEAPKALLEKIEQVVRLIRSKGIGVYFVTQNPLDVPDTVLAQLGNRVQHALRAFTPRDQKAVKATAETMRPNPAFDTETVITELGVGEALISFLDEKGRPCITERCFVIPPPSQIGPITAAERDAIIKASLLFGHYEKQVDGESAYEMLRKRAESPEADADTGAKPRAGGLRKEADEASTGGGFLKDVLGTMVGGGSRSKRSDGIVESMAKSAARSIGTQLGRQILRGVLGSLAGGRRR